MANDWWANQIGAAARATALVDEPPNYQLAYDAGTAPWDSQSTFNAFVADQARRTERRRLARARAQQEEDTSWLYDAAKGVGGALMQGVGFLAGGPFQDLDAEQDREQGAAVLKGALTNDIPGTSFSAGDVLSTLDRAILDPIETPFIARTLDYREGRGDNKWWSADSWGRAWDMARDTSPGAAILDWAATWEDPKKTKKDLDRLRRTSSVYGALSFGADLWVGWKLDPTVLGAKGISEAKMIRAGELPRGTASTTVASQAAKTAATGERYTGLNPARHYGSWRGQMVRENWQPVWDIAERGTFTDLVNQPMFRRNAVAGPQIALAMKQAVGDEKLMDLTQRAAMADKTAWDEIARMRQDPDYLREAYGTENAATYIDALDAVKTQYKDLDNQISDLEKMIEGRRQEFDDIGAEYGGFESGFFEYYNQELYADLATKQARLVELGEKLRGDQKYTDWLDSVPGHAGDGPTGRLYQVKAYTKPGSRDYLNRRTYQRSIYSPVHSVYQKSLQGFYKTANPIDFHRTEVGIESIRRQFAQFNRYFGFDDPAVMDDVLVRFTQAMTKDDKFQAFQIAREVEEQHLVKAIHEWTKKFDGRPDAPGIDEDMIRQFLGEVRFQQNEMAKALVTGKGAVYTTAPSIADAPGAQVVAELPNGQMQVEFTVGSRRSTVWLSKQELQARAETGPVDPTQTANWYIPQNTRELFMEFKRDAEKWQALDSEWRNLGRRGERFFMGGVDRFGTQFNRFWKPLQLFRVAWPMRVLMDENLRGLAVLGMMPTVKAYSSAYADAAVNAINPLQHPGTWPGVLGAAAGAAAGTAVAGPFGFVGGLAAGSAAAGGATAFIRRELMTKRIRIGNGPLADQATGRTFSQVHDTAAAAAPAVPSYMAPRKMRKRTAAMDYTMARVATGDHDAPVFRAFNRFNATGESKMIVDPVNGKVSKSGWAIPIHTEQLSSPQALDGFLLQNRDLLSSGGYRLMFERNPDGTTHMHLVRLFSKGERDKAAEFAVHTESSRLLLNIGTGYKEFARDTALVANGELRRSELEAIDGMNLELNVDNLDMALDSPYSALSKSILARRNFAGGTQRFRTKDGEVIETQAALGEDGDFYKLLMSSTPAYARLTDDYRRTLNLYRGRAAGYKVITRPDLSQEALLTKAGMDQAREYLTSWATVLNEQIRNSPIWRKMLEGKSDDDILHWLENTAEGARIRRQIPHKGYFPEKWVAEHRQALDFYLPARHLQRRLRDRQIMPSELRYLDPADMPDVYGADIELIQGDVGWGKVYGQMLEKTYRALGSVPTDTLSRQPFFKGMYDLHMRNLLRQYDAADIDQKTLHTFEKLSREFALRQVKRTMYDLGDEDNITQMIRFMAPFWGAQQEAITKWARIIADKPETMARFFVGIDAVYDNFKVIDEDDNLVKGPQSIYGYNPNHRVVLQIPKSLEKIPPFDKMLKSFGSVAVAFGAANTAFQGDNPLIPSLGPVVVLPANEFMRAYWKTHGTEYDSNFFYRWLFPVGRPQSNTFAGRVLENMMPGWQKRIAAVSAGHDSRTLMNTYVTISREMKRAARRKGLPEPTPEEIQEATNWHFALRTLASFGAPAAMQFRPKHQFYLDQYHQMQRKYGVAAFERFVEKFGEDAARYAASGSKGLIAPTSRAMADWRDAEKLIAKYPDWSQAIISPDAWADEFSSDSYGAQFQIHLAPDDDTPLREFQNPRERDEQIEQRLGWMEYRRFMSALDAELYARGLTSVESNGAEDLKALKAAKVADMRERYPGWSADIDTFENTIYTRVDQLRDIAFRPRYDRRPDMLGARQYLMLRDDVAAELDRYAATGGARSLQAKENTALRQWFYDQVGQLIQDNPAFGEFYSRYLSQDTLERGSGAPLPQ